MENIKAESHNQSGGITVGKVVINTRADQNDKFWPTVKKLFLDNLFKCLLAFVIPLLLSSYGGEWYKEPMSDTYHVSSEGQSGGITAGRIDKVVINDDSLKPRDPNGFYRDGVKIGVVSGATVDATAGIFYFDEIRLNQVAFDTNEFSDPAEFQSYLIKANNFESISLSPPRATKVSGVIMGTR